MSGPQRSWDAVIVGGGHNGLVAAFYLARAGLRTLVCERREIVGGCCGTSFGHLAAMRHALDAHKKAERPTIATIVERIGPLRNKQAAANTAETSEARRERRRSRG